MAIDNKTFLDDAQSLKALIESMPTLEGQTYSGYGAMALESAFPGRKMIVYTIKSGAPSDIEVITFGSFMCDEQNGPSAWVTVSGNSLLIPAVPTRIPQRDVYLHIPQNFILKYKGRKKPGAAVDFVTHYAVLIKTRSKDIHRVEGHSYCIAPNKFREHFPDLKIRF